MTNEDDQTGDTEPARRLIQKPHGGAILRLATGQKMTGWKSARKDALKNLRTLTPKSVERIRDMVRSTDERVAMVAAKAVLDRTLGKPSDKPQGDDNGPGAADLANLTTADRIELSVALATVKRLTGRGPGAL